MSFFLRWYLPEFSSAVAGYPASLRGWELAPVQYPAGLRQRKQGSQGRDPPQTTTATLPVLPTGRKALLFLPGVPGGVEFPTTPPGSATAVGVWLWLFSGGGRAHPPKVTEEGSGFK